MKTTKNEIRRLIRTILVNENFGALPLADTEFSMDGKYASKQSIKNAVYNVLKRAKVEGLYRDDYWEGVKKLTDALSDAGIDFSLQKANYFGHYSPSTKSSLPTGKEYKYFLRIKDKEGKDIHLPLKVICAFVGKTGTMEDDVYELTYYIEA